MHPMKTTAVSQSSWYYFEMNIFISQSIYDTIVYRSEFANVNKSGKKLIMGPSVQLHRVLLVLVDFTLGHRILNEFNRSFWSYLFVLVALFTAVMDAVDRSKNAGRVVSMLWFGRQLGQCWLARCAIKMMYAFCESVVRFYSWIIQSVGVLIGQSRIDWGSMTNWVVELMGLAH